MAGYCNERLGDTRQPHHCLCIHLAGHSTPCECACGHTWNDPWLRMTYDEQRDFLGLRPMKPRVRVFDGDWNEEFRAIGNDAMEKAHGFLAKSRMGAVRYTLDLANGYRDSGVLFNSRDDHPGWLTEQMRRRAFDLDVSTYGLQPPTKISKRY